MQLAAYLLLFLRFGAAGVALTLELQLRPEHFTLVYLFSRGIL